MKINLKSNLEKIHFYNEYLALLYTVVLEGEIMGIEY